MLRDSYRFRLVLSGPSIDGQTVERLLSVGLNDAMFGVQDGQTYAEFDRVAISFEIAVLTAVRDVEQHSEYMVDRVEPDDLVTMTGIAERLDLTRQSIALLVSGRRGDGTFPRPLSTADGKTRIWRWTEVERWFGERGDTGPQTDLRKSSFVGSINAALALRRHMTEYEHEGGDPGVGDLVRGLMRDQLPATFESLAPPVTTRPCSPLNDLVKDATTTGMAFARVLERTQTNVAVFVSWVLDDLVAAVNDELITKRITRAASAYERSMTLRRFGELESAALFDHAVMRDTILIVDSLDEVGTTSGLNMQECGRYGHCEVLGPYVRGHLSTSERKVPTFDYGFSAMARRLQREPGDKAGHLYLFNACQAVGAISGRGTGVVAPECPDAIWPQGRDLGLGVETTVHRYDSARELLMSSWMLASTFRLLIHNHLPLQMRAADDAVARILDDLAECQFA